MYRGRLCLDGRDLGPGDTGAAVADAPGPWSPSGPQTLNHLAPQVWYAHDTGAAPNVVRRRRVSVRRYDAGICAQTFSAPVESQRAPHGCARASQCGAATLGP